jgi:hypothetical protein
MALGLLSFIPLVGVLAFIIGGGARTRIHDSGGRLVGDEMARAGMWLGGGATVLSFCAACVLSCWAMDRSGGRYDSCRSNLKQIGLAIGMYQSDHSDEMPATLQALLDERYMRSPYVYTCPGADLPRKDERAYPSSQEFDRTDVDQTGDYLYARPSGAVATRVPVAWDRFVHANGMVSVLYFDLHVAIRRPSQLAAEVAANRKHYAAIPPMPLAMPVKRDWLRLGLFLALAGCLCLALWPVVVRLARTVRGAFP